jgi:sarcosine oxidase, subunit beta
MTGTPSVIVLGGGAIGMSVALHLHWRGAKVRLLERGALGAGVSQLGGGWVAAQGRRNPAQLAFALESIAHYPHFLDRVGARAGLRESGSFLLLETEAQVAQRRAFLADQMQVPGYDGFTFLSPAELTKLEPAIRSPHIICGTYRDRDCSIDPPALVAALAGALRREGLAVEGAPVEGLRRTATGWEASTPVGDFGADVVVNAAGAWARPLSAMVGMDLPLGPISGQIMTTPPRAPYVRSLIVVAHNPDLPGCPPRDLRQGADGRLWVGTVNHHGSADAAVRRADTDAIRAAMSRIFPELADVTFDRGYAGTRALPSDGLPVYGRVGTEPFYVAVPMSGIAEAAAAGRTMADLIIDGHCPTLPAAFSPDRLKDLPPPTGTGGH